jgi:hypothetical protein
MDRLATLTRDLSSILDEIYEEAERRELTRLNAPLAWLAEAHGWLRWEVDRAECPEARDKVPFTYVPAEYRR